MMVIHNKFQIGQMVYLITDEDQHKRVITSIQVYKEGELVYKVAHGTGGSEHYEFELSAEKDIVLTTTN